MYIPFFNHKTGVTGALLLVVAALTAVPGCKHEPVAPLVVDDGGGGGGVVLVDDSLWVAPINTTPCAPGTVYFQNTVFPLLVSYCATTGCHNVATDDNEHVRLTSYGTIMNEVDAGSPSNSNIWQNGLNQGGGDAMPPSNSPQMTSAQEQAIYNWISQGASNNFCNDCDTTNVTYNATIKPIFQAKCNGCHSGSNQNGNLDLSQWSTCNSIALGNSLEGSIKHIGGFSHMPPYDDDSYLPACDIYKLMIWKRQGAPNN